MPSTERYTNYLSSQTFRYTFRYMELAYAYLPPANEVCEGYVFTCVCLSTVGECLPHCMLGYTPHQDQRQTTPEQASPWEQTPPPRDQRQTPPKDQTPPAVHAGRYGQQAGGTHPTGMHTCLNAINTAKSLPGNFVKYSSKVMGPVEI